MSLIFKAITDFSLIVVIRVKITTLEQHGSRFAYTLKTAVSLSKRGIFTCTPFPQAIYWQ